MLIRITGGEFRGRKIKSPHGESSRPTLDRVREALFNIIGNDLSGQRFLDLYAGVGLVGLEALSRGASEAVFLERETALVKILRENIAFLGVESRARVYQGSASGLVLRLIKKQFEIIFVDPPYGGDELTLVLSKMAFSGIPADCWIVAQHHYKDKLPAKIGSLRAFREEKYGETLLSFFKRELLTG